MVYGYAGSRFDAFIFQYNLQDLEQVALFKIQIRLAPALSVEHLDEFRFPGD